MDVRRMVIWVAALAVVGWAAPRYIGASFFSPHLMLIFASMAILFQASLICDSVASDAGRTRPPGVLYRKLATAALFGFVSSLLLMIIRTVAGNREIAAPYFVYPDAPVIGALLLFAAGFAVTGAAAGAAITLYSYAPDVARQRMRRGFLALLLIAVIGVRSGPEWLRAGVTSRLTNDSIVGSAVITAAVCLALAAILIRAAARHPQYSGKA